VGNRTQVIKVKVGKGMSPDHEVMLSGSQDVGNDKKEYRDLVVIPYVAGLSEAIRRVGDSGNQDSFFSRETL
jgi:hypothetical protein